MLSASRPEDEYIVCAFRGEYKTEEGAREMSKTGIICICTRYDGSRQVYNNNCEIHGNYEETPIQVMLSINKERIEKLEAENAALRSRRIADIPDPNSTLLQYIEKLDRGFCSDQPVNLGGVGWPFIRDHVRSLQESFKMQVDISFKLINENASLKQRLEIATEAIKKIVSWCEVSDSFCSNNFENNDCSCIEHEVAKEALSKLESKGGEDEF